MANFEQAIKWMKEGKKVRIKSKYGSQEYLYFEDGVVRHNCGISHYFSLDDIESTDWEIYEEEDNWSLKDLMETNFDNSDLAPDEYYFSDDIETLKEKILEDLDKLEENRRHKDIHFRNILNKRFGLKNEN